MKTAFSLIPSFRNPVQSLKSPSRPKVLKPSGAKTRLQRNLSPYYHCPISPAWSLRGGTSHMLLAQMSQAERSFGNRAVCISYDNSVFSYLFYCFEESS